MSLLYFSFFFFVERKCIKKGESSDYSLRRTKENNEKQQSKYIRTLEGLSKNKTSSYVNCLSLYFSSWENGIESLKIQDIHGYSIKLIQNKIQKFYLIILNLTCIIYLNMMGELLSKEILTNCQTWWGKWIALRERTKIQSPILLHGSQKIPTIS